MKQRVLLTATLVILGTLALTTVLAHAQTTSNGPYYATPSWDQQLPVSTRFIVLSNWIDAAHPSGGTAVLDRETGLVWEQNPDVSVPATWIQAISANTIAGCIGRVTGGRAGWRLPRIEELASLTTGQNPTSSTGPFTDLPSGHPFGSNASGTFWSATTNVIDSSGSVAEVLSFGATANPGSVHSDFKTAQHRVWCVRSPSPGFVGQ